MLEWLSVLFWWTGATVWLVSGMSGAIALTSALMCRLVKAVHGFDVVMRVMHVLSKESQRRGK